MLGPLDQGKDASDSVVGSQDEDKPKPDDEDKDQDDDAGSVDTTFNLLSGGQVQLDHQVDEPITSGSDAIDIPGSY